MMRDEVSVNLIQRLTPTRCRLLLVAMVTLLFACRLEYLLVHCPADLSGDEAQYWDWSRRLGLCYYSKGPVIAYIIRASCAVFGNRMWAVRLPALLLNAGTAIITYRCTLRLFGSEKLALGAAALLQLVPIVIAGGYLMTIDSPLFFCWALATDLLAAAMFQDKRWAWPLLGIVIGVGSLTKYAMLLYLPIMAVILLVDIDGRRRLRTRGPWLATAIALACLTPALLWNAQHDWVSLRHVAHQTGATGGRFSNGDTLETIGAQIGAAGPTIAVLMMAGIICAFGRRNRRAMFLANIGIVFLLFNLLASFVAKVQQNWPAPAYFSLAILAAWFLAKAMRERSRSGDASGASWRDRRRQRGPMGLRLNGRIPRSVAHDGFTRPTWRHWNGLLYASIAIGIGTMVVSRDPTILFPVAKPFVKKNLASVDLLSRLRGWKTCGQRISDDLASMPSGSFVLCDDYQQTAEMAFYVRGQPVTYCAGPYLGARLSQYDMWPDHRLDATSPVVGRDAIYLGKGGDMPALMYTAFASIEPLPDLDIIVRGVRVKRFRTWKCRDFRGFDAINSLGAQRRF